MTTPDKPQPWICDTCGEVCDGDLCIGCGNTRPIEYRGPAAGSYQSITGMPPSDPLGKKLLLPFFLVFVGGLLLAIGQALFASCGN